VIAAHAIAMIWPAPSVLAGPQIILLAMVSTAIYAFGSLAIRRLCFRQRIDLLQRRAVFSFILIVPVIAFTLSAATVAAEYLTGAVSSDAFYGAVLNGFAGNAAGIILAAPFFLWTGTAIVEALVESLGGAAAGTSPWSNPPISSWRTAVPLAIAGVLSYVSFGWLVTDRFVFFCLISAPLVAMALKHGLDGVTTILLMVGLAAVGNVQTGNDAGAAIWLQAVVLVSSTISMIVGSLVAELHNQQQTTKRHAALLNSVSFATEQLLAMTDQDKNVNEVLHHLATEARVSHIFVLENRQGADGAAYEIAYEHWSAGAVADQHYLQLLNVVRSKHIRDCVEALAQGEALQYRTADLCEEEHAIMTALNILGAKEGKPWIKYGY
jgi:hypothetical protein